MIRFIRGSWEAMNKKRKFDGVGDQSSHEGSWDRNGSRFGGGRGGRGGGKGRGGRGGNGTTTTPPPTETDRKIEAAVRTDRKEVSPF